MITNSPLPSVASGQEIDACWNKIGVRGDKSCSRLEGFVHCRNCPVYSAAAGKILDRPNSADELALAAWLFSGSKVVEQRGKRSAFLFRIGEEWLALPTSALSEVADLRRIHPLPHRLGGIVTGLANVRGELLVCVSLSYLLEIVAGPSSGKQQIKGASSRLLVVQRAGHRVAFPVDEVHGTERFNDEDLKPVPRTVERASSTYTASILPWKNISVGILDEELLFHTFNKSLS